MTELAKQFQVNLNELVGENRAQVHIIHHDIDICINSQERELLYAIQELQKEKYNKVWIFSEKLFTKALMISIEKSPIPDFDGFSEKYKKHYQERIQLIINNYDEKFEDSTIFVVDYNDKYIEIMENFVFVDKKISIKYEDVKEVYRKLVAEDYVDYDKYKTLRDIFEKLRYSRIIIGQ